MSMIFNKLKSNKGETLVESMAAILVFTFASIIMMSMISTAADINTTAKEADRDFQEQMVVVEKADGTPIGTGTVVTFTFSESVSETVAVDVFQQSEGALYAYYEKSGGGTE